MTVQLFLVLLTTFSAISTLVTEAIKKIKAGSCSSNIIAIVTALVVGCGGTGVYYVFYDMPFSTVNIICLILMGFACGLASMLGYDKIVQTIEQITEKKEEK